MSQLVYKETLAATQRPRRSETSLATGSAIAILSAGRDKPYALGLAAALSAVDVTFDFIGSDIVDSRNLHTDPHVRFFNLRNQQTNANFAAKVMRVLSYYARLIGYAATAKAKVFHILWNNKFELFDRTLLMLYYKLLGKRVVLTVHNVNSGRRDATDSALNRLSLRIQYRLSDHIFTHTAMMKRELMNDFTVAEEKVSVIPFGINNTVPNTSLSDADAKRFLKISSNDQTLLCYGHIAPYKGLEYVVTACAELLNRDGSYRLIIAGKPKWNEAYWKHIERLIKDLDLSDRVIQRIEHVPDDETELYFKAADVLVLPYVHVFQSGVLFLGYSFGLPAIVADVGSLREEVIEGQTGFVCSPRDASDLANTIERYFKSDLFYNLHARRAQIKKYANERYSWSKVAEITTGVYSRLLRCGEAGEQGQPAAQQRQ